MTVQFLNLDKKSIIEKFKISDNDTGSACVQVALITKKALNLTQHIAKNSKDNVSRKSIVELVRKRARLLKYLKINKIDLYLNLIKELGIRDSIAL